VDVSFRGEVWFWRGPAPFHFVTVPEEPSGTIAAASELVTYGWGMIPVSVRVGATAFTTSLWPKDGGYILPIKTAVRRAEGIELGDAVDVAMTIGV
jgi:hypothetical protein